MSANQTKRQPNKFVKNFKNNINNNNKNTHTGTHKMCWRLKLNNYAIYTSFIMIVKQQQQKSNIYAIKFYHLTL